MAEAPAGQQSGGAGGPGGEAPKVDPSTARAFVAQFLPDPKIGERWQDPEVLAYHGKVRTAVDSAVQEEIKKRGPFGTDWRQTLAGDNKDALPTLERFQEPRALLDSYLSLKSKISTGELKALTPYPDKGTDEQKAAWRTEQGLPATPKEYKVELPAGMVVGEADQPFVDGFLEFAHGRNMAPQAVSAALTFWGEERERRREVGATQAAALKQETEDKLRAEWGEDYRPTKTRITSLLDANLPAGSQVRDQVLNTIDTNIDFAHLMANIATQLNPVPSLPGMGAEGQVTSITDWLNKADKMMRTDRKAYNNSEYSKDYAKYANAFKTHTGKEWGRA